MWHTSLSLSGKIAHTLYEVYQAPPSSSQRLGVQGPQLITNHDLGLLSTCRCSFEVVFARVDSLAELRKGASDDMSDSDDF